MSAEQLLLVTNIDANVCQRFVEVICIRKNTESLGRVLFVYAGIRDIHKYPLKSHTGIYM